MADITFVTVGQLTGKTINLGPDGKYRFVNGEMRVPDDQASLVATALRFYCAFPKGDARPYHEAACAKLGVDPDTMQPLTKKRPPKRKTPRVVKEPEVIRPYVAPEPEIVDSMREIEQESEVVAQPSTQEIRQVVAEVLRDLDPYDDEHWTKAGDPSVAWVRNQLDPDVAALTDRAMLDEFDVVRPT